MENNIKYVHTNLIAKDWKKLADFYIQIFNCKPIPPEMDLSGNWIDKLTGIPDVKLRGIHLILPGFDKGPTLEIFEYSPEFTDTDIKHINQKGFGHIAFHVDSVEEILKILLAYGGSQLGEVIKKDYGEIGILTAVYLTDPEGNFIEIQNWKK